MVSPSSEEEDESPPFFDLRDFLFFLVFSERTSCWSAGSAFSFRDRVEPFELVGLADVVGNTSSLCPRENIPNMLFFSLRVEIVEGASLEESAAFSASRWEVEIPPSELATLLAGLTDTGSCIDG